MPDPREAVHTVLVSLRFEPPRSTAKLKAFAEELATATHAGQGKAATRQAYVHVLNSLLSSTRAQLRRLPPGRCSLRPPRSLPSRWRHRFRQLQCRALKSSPSSAIVQCEEEDSRMLGDAELIEDSWLVLAILLRRHHFLFLSSRVLAVAGV